MTPADRGRAKRGARRERAYGVNLLAVAVALVAALVAMMTVRLSTMSMATAEALPRPSAAPRAPRIRVPWKDLVAAFIALYVLSAFLVVNYVLPGRVSPEMNLYVVQPLMWGGLALVSLIALWRAHDAPMFSAGMVIFGIWAAGFQIAVQIGMGLIYGFGYSPYARETVHMLENALYLSTLVAGVECSRAYMVGRYYRRSPFATLFLVSALWGMLLVPVDNYNALSATRPGFQFAGETLMPALSVSVLATYLCARGGFAPALVYHFGILAFEWFSPILPHMEWTVAAFVGTSAPLVALMAARSAGADAAAAEVPPEKFDVSAPWVIAAMLVVALLWFNTGLLGVQPEVVNGVSMEPTMYTGDMVIVKDVDVEDLKPGDILQFRVGNTRVFHRIVEVEQTPTGYVFVTKGDNNNTQDDPILEDQVEGKVIFTVPDVGWVPIKINQALFSLR